MPDTKPDTCTQIVSDCPYGPECKLQHAEWFWYCGKSRAEHECGCDSGYFQDQLCSECSGTGIPLGHEFKER